MTILSETIYVKLKEEQQFFELRQQLKESIRKKMRKESGCLCNISQESKKLPGDNYGSFFGHSQPSIARRVIKETKFVLEAKQSAAKFKNSSASKAEVVMQKMKARELASRDYSFIFSDDSENLTSVSSTMGKATQKQKKHLDKGKEKYEPKKAELMSKQVQLPECKVSGEHKISLSKKSNEQCKKFIEPCNAKVTSKQVKSIEKLKSEEKIKVVEHKKAKVIENKLQCSSKGQDSDVDKANCFPKQLEQKKEVNEASILESCSQKKGLNGSSKASLIIKLKIPPKLQIAKEMGICKPNIEVPIPTQKKSYKMHEQKKGPEDNLCYGNEVDKGYISSLCQSLFRRNHKKRVRDDYEDNGDCMVASFADIQREERKSAKIARKEDRIEQLRNEQEEMKERLRRQRKKHKFHHNSDSF